MASTEEQHEFRRLHRKLSRLKKQASVEHDLKVAAEARSHDAKLWAKSSELSLKGLLQRTRKAESDARTYRAWIKNAGFANDICTRNILGEMCDNCQCGILKMRG